MDLALPPDNRVYIPAEHTLHVFRKDVSHGKVKKIKQCLGRISFTRNARGKLSGVVQADKVRLKARIWRKAEFGLFHSFELLAGFIIKLQD